MAPLILRTIRAALNSSLAPIGMQISRIDNHDWRDTANFIPFDRTIGAAEKAGMSVGDYVDSVMNGMPGSSQMTIDKLSSLSVFAQPMDTIVEIGPGTGRYLEKTLKAARPQRYEIYETAGPWATYLVEQYKVVRQQTNGSSLSATPSDSVAMVHAHKVFSGVPFMVTCCYWHEMARVIRQGGWAVFDVFTEDCLRGHAMQIWAESGICNGSFPALVPRGLAVTFFTSKGFTLAGSFIVPMPPGETELLVFRRHGKASCEES
jgi:hypothetical protein